MRLMLQRLLIALVSVASCFAVAELKLRATATDISLEIVLRRASSYVVAQQEQLTAIVAEESYVQEVRSPRETRTLKSDLLLVRLDNVDRYLEFRDVFEVDGREVRDREERLTRLFLDPSPSAVARGEAIVMEGARYNIGEVDRTLNTPMLALGFLLPQYQPRFKFTRTSRRRPSVPARFAKAFGVSPEMYVIAFQETSPNTLIRTSRGGDFPARGRFWIDPSSGTVQISELVMTRRDLEAMVTVSYQSQPLLGFRVPILMREEYRWRGHRIEGTATYGRFRQFQVRTDENIAVPDPKLAKPPGKPPS